MARPGLTARQKQALDFIRAEIAANGVPPSYAEITSALGLSSKSNVARIIDVLTVRGYITMRRASGRSIALIEDDAADGERMREALRRITQLPPEHIGLVVQIARTGLGDAA